MKPHTRLLRKLYKTSLEHRILSRWFVLAIDLLLVTKAALVSYFFTLQIYNNIHTLSTPKLGEYLAFSIGISFVYFLVLRTYVGIIRYSTIFEFARSFTALSLTTGTIFLYLYFQPHSSGSISVAYCLTFMLFSLLGLFVFRVLVILTYRYLRNRYSDKITEVFLWGVDEKSISMSQLLNTTQSNYRVKGFIGDSQNSKFFQNTNLPIVKKDIDYLKYRVKNVLFVDSNNLRENQVSAEKLIKKGLHIYTMHNVNINNLDALLETSRSIRPIQIEDLLGRPQIEISIETIFDSIKGKRVLVTGAAGSIGSEIVRQLANFDPKLVICLDQAETPLHELSLELSKTNLNFTTTIVDVRRLNELAKVFENHKPEIVFHAAAYKHVPLMEKEPCAAITTNVGGTKYITDLSIQYNVDTFVMISTDKAVNPTNIMGASKRIAEIYTQACALDEGVQTKTRTKFITTRFGNVLGSNGSVIPLFKKQIQKGGPITVTDKNITRYFMTIPEACRLVLEASVIGRSGHIYVFDMGEPVKIYDLAQKMIELSGLRPHIDVKIEFTGLRPGEKLYEELLSDSEVTKSTDHQKIKVARVRKYTLSEITPLINELMFMAQCYKVDELVQQMKFMIPEYISQNSEFAIYDKKININA